MPGEGRADDRLRHVDEQNAERFSRPILSRPPTGERSFAEIDEEMALFIAMQAENAVVSACQVVVPLRLHSRLRPALIEIETVASVKARSEFPHRHRLVPLL